MTERMRDAGATADEQLGQTLAPLVDKERAERAIGLRCSVRFGT